MLAKDLTFAWRTLRRSPAFALTAVVTIALGIGASTAIFSVTHAVLLRPLPYRNPDRLVLACGDMRKRNVKDFPFSNADFFDLRNSAKSTFEEFTAVTTGRGPLPREDGTPEQVAFARITPNFFRMMGAKIAFGRDFMEADGLPQPPLPPVAGAAPPPPRLPVIAILSYPYFQRVALPARCRYGTAHGRDRRPHGARGGSRQHLPACGGLAALFFAIAALACWLPARRAAGLDPTQALREE